MNIWDDPNPVDDYKKWSGWTMHPQKRSMKLTDYASAFVFVISGVQVMGLFAV